MKNKRGLAAAAVFTALAISTTGAINGELQSRGNDSALLQMWASLHGLDDGDRAIPGPTVEHVDRLPELVLSGAPDTYPAFEPVEELTPELATPSPTATIEPEPTPVPTRIPYVAPLPSTPKPATQTATSDVVTVFVQGWTAGGGDAVSVRIVLCVMGKESGGDPGAYNPAGPFYGLMQFLASTWAAMGGGDWRDPYQQGVNTAKLWRAASPASQWPVAYRLCTAGG